MARKRRRFSAEFTAKVAVEALRGQKTVAKLASEYEVHRSQIGQWKKQLLAALPEVFGRLCEQSAAAQADMANEPHQQIGQLKVELGWFKKDSSGNRVGSGCKELLPVFACPGMTALTQSGMLSTTCDSRDFPGRFRQRQVPMAWGGGGAAWGLSAILPLAIAFFAPPPRRFERRNTLGGWLAWTQYPLGHWIGLRIRMSRMNQES